VSREVVELRAGETARAWAAMRELRPHIGTPEEFAARVDEVQRPQGYRLVATFEPGDDDAAAVAGFRVGDNLAWGRFLYVDDLVCRAALRRRGHARALLRWLTDEAARLGCDALHLDSGAGPDRFDAHAAYFAHGLRITSHHFAMPIGRGRAEGE
jgi:GNAT superfamily N-acetyltransferase